MTNTTPSSPSLRDYLRLSRGLSDSSISFLFSEAGYLYQELDWEVEALLERVFLVPGPSIASFSDDQELYRVLILCQAPDSPSIRIGGLKIDFNAPQPKSPVSEPPDALYLIMKHLPTIVAFIIVLLALGLAGKWDYQAARMAECSEFSQGWDEESDQCRSRAWFNHRQGAASSPVSPVSSN